MYKALNLALFHSGTPSRVYKNKSSHLIGVLLDLELFPSGVNNSKSIPLLVRNRMGEQMDNRDCLIITSLWSRNNMIICSFLPDLWSKSRKLFLEFNQTSTRTSHSGLYPSHRPTVFGWYCGLEMSWLDICLISQLVGWYIDQVT